MPHKVLLMTCLLLAWPAWAQSQAPAAAQAKASARKPNGPQADASMAARLQAQAIADAAAAAQAAKQATTRPDPLVQKAMTPSGVASTHGAALPRSSAASTLPLQASEATDPLLEPAPPLAGALSAETVHELAIARQIHQGLMPCEMGVSVRVEADASQPGYFHVQGRGFRYRMYPVRSRTGALRLEDRKAGAVWLQLANKSMLMDQNKGRRLADECANAEQVAYAETLKTNPPPSLIDTTGMGR